MSLLSHIPLIKSQVVNCRWRKDMTSCRQLFSLWRVWKQVKQLHAYAIIFVYHLSPAHTSSFSLTNFFTNFLSCVRQRIFLPFFPYHFFFWTCMFPAPKNTYFQKYIHRIWSKNRKTCNVAKRNQSFKYTNNKVPAFVYIIPDRPIHKPIASSNV
jgi:hypothetical protein